MGDQGTKSKKK
jgi:hypothetical protein